MVTCKSANQLKTLAKVSWAFKMVSQFGSLVYTITRKTADLTVVQKSIIDTLHKEGKPQTLITKEAGCSQSAVSKHVNRKLSGRKKCRRKRCTTNRENGCASCALWGLSSKIDSRYLVNLCAMTFEHFMLPSANQLFKDADVIFQQDLAPAHTAKSTKSWLKDHDVGVCLTGQKTHQTWTPERIYELSSKGKWETRDQKMQMSLRPVKETWASISPQQCQKLITSMPRRIEAVIKAKEAPNKYWVHIQ